MNYVLDASVALAWVIRRPTSQKALKLREDFQQSVHLLLAPTIFQAESASALTKAERQQVIPVGQARLLLADILTTPPVLHPYDPFLDRATDISSRTRSGLHDCLYLVLAEQEGCELITVDDKFLRNIQHQFPFVRHLSTI